MIFQFLDYICFYIAFFAFFYFVFSKKYREKSKIQTVKIIIVSLVNIIYILLGLTWCSEILWRQYSYIFALLLIYVLMDVDILELIYLSIFQCVITGLIKISVFFALINSELLDASFDSVAYMIAIVFVSVIYGLLNRRSREIKIIDIKFWVIWDSVLLIFLLVLYVIINELGYKLYHDIIIEFRYNIYALTVLLAFSLPIVILKAYREKQKEYLKNAMTELQIEEQKKYYELLLDKENETKKFRHDIINDFLSMQHYLEINDLDKLKARIDAALGEMNKISKKCYDVGNDEINVILNYYLEPLKGTYEIKVKGFISNDINIENRDISFVCGNIVKNAVEAIEKTKEGIINFDVKEGKDYISIKLSNSFQEQVEFDKSGLPITRKKEKEQHGFGLKNVLGIVKKYNGSYKISIEDNMYCIDIFLKKNR